MEKVEGTGAGRLREERGQTLVEYALIIAVVSLGALTALGFLSGKIQALFSKAGNSINAVSVSAGAGGTTPADPAPTVVGFSIADVAGNTGLAQATDRITITFSEPLAVNTLCAGWSGSGNQSTTGTVFLDNNSGGGLNDGLRFRSVGCTSGVDIFGAVSLNGNFVNSGDATFSGSTFAWNAGSATLTITLGTLGGAGNLNVFVTLSNAQYVPAGGITDTTGQGLVGGATTGAAVLF